MVSPVPSGALEDLIATVIERHPRYIVASCLATVIDALNNLNAGCHEAVVGVLEKTCSNALFLGALFESNWMPKIAAKHANSSVSALFAGALEGSGSARQELLLILGKLELPRPLFMDLCSRINAVRDQNAPRVERQVVALLIDAVLLTDMPEASKCLLVSRLYMGSSRDVYAKLKDMPATWARDSLIDGYRAIASCIDISACLRWHQAGRTPGASLTANVRARLNLPKARGNWLLKGRTGTRRERNCVTCCAEPMRSRK